MGISRDRIRSRKPASPEDAEQAEALRLLGEGAHRIRSIDSRFALLLNTIEMYGPESDALEDSDVLDSWPVFRHNVKIVRDYIEKNRGRVPPRLDKDVVAIRARLAELARYPTVPGSPWADLQSLLTKMRIFREKTA
jgi:hypothetical protein